MTYILVPIVLLIWGYIAYEVINYGEAEEVIEPIRIDAITSQDKSMQVEKTLNLQYRDPFLKGRSTKVVSPKPVNKKKVVKKPVKPVEWGEITYNGYIQNKNSRRKIGLLNINGARKLANKGDVSEGITIIDIREDSILLKKEEVTKWFLKFKKN